MLPAPNRLRERADFASVARGRGSSRAGSRLLVVHATRTDTRADAPPRVGFVVSKGVGNAVVRNRTKRRLRALAAPLVRELPAGVDVVVRANPPAGSAGWDQLAQALEPLWHKAVRRAMGAA
ncbi:ribonuclease P protein component [Phycicoccus sp. CSK15P-2]|uniref:ribonuclease P protein component n=1 Tax=Phycicoccus sp. CSK15P-2 TaxID=2807627 RepID=UPI00195105FD|nr:ribonuclease P protein component [Phycicoccus sp. CSK15P-2]MBM6403474.1 ribonuclease P protein component [Phycicoccus sp. CSK15P-2]